MIFCIISIIALPYLNFDKHPGLIKRYGGVGVPVKGERGTILPPTANLTWTDAFAILTLHSL
jgi:hypothetical protein